MRTRRSGDSLVVVAAVHLEEFEAHGGRLPQCMPGQGVFEESELRIRVRMSE